MQIPQIKKSKGFASVSTQNENENPFDFFRTLFGMVPLCSVSLLARNFYEFSVKIQTLDVKMFSFLMFFDDAEGFIAGGTAGVVVETALYPIDTIKTRLQASQKKVHFFVLIEFNCLNKNKKKMLNYFLPL